MAFTAPHVPIREPDEFVRRVPAEITEPSRREYAAAVIHLDDAIGRLLDVLRRTGNWENTMVVFTSDNGAVPNNPNYPLGTSGGYLPDNYAQGPAGGDNRPLRGQKGTIYEGGIRTPTLVSWPGHLPPGKLDAAVHMVDWMPTFCALAGYRPEINLQWDGKDVWPRLSGSGQIEPRPLYWSSPGLDVRAVRLGDWKLIVRYPHRILGPLPPRGASAELFNLATDPNETTDLASREPGKVNELLAVLAEMARTDGDALAND
jgi:arylsulfatase A-like enzyme